MKAKLALLVLIVASSGCYHATVETGLQPSSQRLEKRWASSWVYGLVPPSVVQTAQRCPSGVAKVDTQLSFTNQLVSFFTLGIYTPMEIVVTCAEARAGASIPAVRNIGNASSAVKAAVQMSAAENTPVLVAF